MTGRAFKQDLLEVLRTQPQSSIEKKIEKLPPLKIINALFSFLQNTDPKIKWAAVTLMGAIVEKIAAENLETARVIMRRLMWNLNDESGGIGWGSPEAMGEILARHKGLAEEYGNILLSYVRKDGNYLEHEMLQRGLLWGIARFAQVRPQLIEDSLQYIIPCLESKDAEVRGLAAWIVGLVGTHSEIQNLEWLRNDETEIPIYMNGKITDVKIKDLAFITK